MTVMGRDDVAVLAAHVDVAAGRRPRCPKDRNIKRPGELANVVKGEDRGRGPPDVAMGSAAAGSGARPGATPPNSR